TTCVASSSVAKSTVATATDGTASRSLMYMMPNPTESRSANSLGLISSSSAISQGSFPLGRAAPSLGRCGWRGQREHRSVEVVPQLADRDRLRVVTAPGVAQQDMAVRDPGYLVHLAGDDVERGWIRAFPSRGHDGGLALVQELFPGRRGFLIRLCGGMNDA